jgi:hypothetical protein
MHYLKLATWGRRAEYPIALDRGLAGVESATRRAGSTAAAGVESLAALATLVELGVVACLHLPTLV